MLNDKAETLSLKLRVLACRANAASWVVDSAQRELRRLASQVNGPEYAAAQDQLKRAHAAAILVASELGIAL